jgi:hypothetical protein
VLEMMLDAIAVKFILELDEEFASSEWWDPNRRWIRAGAMELILGNTLRKSVLENPESFAKYGRERASRERTSSASPLS